MQQLNLKINSPCSENFNNFDTTDKGGFCNVCNKNVIDFRNMTATELVKFFEENQSSTCGIFKISQMKTYSNPVITTKKTKFQYLKVLGLAVLSLFTFQTISAQQSVKSEVLKTAIAQDGLLTGTVLDHENLPLPGVSIVLKGTKIGTTTDFEGKYTFPQKLKTDDVLVFSYLGYSPVRKKIKENQTVLDLTLNADLVELMGAVSNNKVYKSKSKR